MSWNAASDNTGVSTYQVLVDNSLVHSTSETSYSLTPSNLSSTKTSYNIVVKAFDAAGNNSLISTSFTTLWIQPAKLTGISFSPNTASNGDSVTLTLTFDCDDIEYECPTYFMAYYWREPTSGDRDIEWGGQACSGGTCTMPKTIYPSTMTTELCLDYIRVNFTGAGVGSNVYYRFDGTVGNPNPGYNSHNLSFINYKLSRP